MPATVDKKRLIKYFKTVNIDMETYGQDDQMIQKGAKQR
jgi:hypothetical protein